MKMRIFFVLAVVAIVSFSARAELAFYDDFEQYDVEDPSDFSVGDVATGNWATDPSTISRIFNTGNFGGTRLWICGASSDVTLTSQGISVESDTYYIFKAALVGETSVASRHNDATYDILVGTDAASAVSIIGGPVAVITSGDDSGGAGNDSYDEQYTTAGFTTGTIDANDMLFIVITHIAGGDAWFGVDNVSIEMPDLTDLIESDGQTHVSEDGLDDSYEIRVYGVGADDVEVTVTPDAQIDLGAGAGVAINAVFTQGGSEIFTIVVNAVDDAIVEGDHSGTISHTITSDDASYTVLTFDDVAVTIEDNEPYCGDSNTIYLLGDLNRDCYVNLLDIAELALEWMMCTDPADPLCIAQ